MPKAEFGSTKHVANQMKAKGLQRLRWYCTPCAKQCRDENGFKQHTLSEIHARNLQLVGANPRAFIARYSADFRRDFIGLLRTSHGEKSVGLNRFYQEYIADREHVHLNATQWNSLTEFARQMGREGVVRVGEEEEGGEVEHGRAGLTIAWVDSSPEAVRRQEASRKKERLDRGDEEREKRAIQEMVERANAEKRVGNEEEARTERQNELKRDEGDKVVLAFGGRKEGQEKESENDKETALVNTTEVKIKISAPSSQKKNVFAEAKKKNPFKSKVLEHPKKISEAERIMKEEIERKRKTYEFSGSNKRQRTNL